MSRSTKIFGVAVVIVLAILIVIRMNSAPTSWLRGTVMSDTGSSPTTRADAGLSENAWQPAPGYGLEDRTSPAVTGDRSDEFQLAERYRRLLQVCQGQLAEEYGITVTDEDVRVYLREMLAESEFKIELPELQRSVRAQIDAAKAVHTGKMSADEAADHFFPDHGGSEVWGPLLPDMATPERIAEMERMYPESLADSIEKSIEGNRALVVGERLAAIILPPEELSQDIGERMRLLEKYMLETARQRILDGDPAFSEFSTEGIDSMLLGLDRAVSPLGDM